MRSNPFAVDLDTGKANTVDLIDRIDFALRRYEDRHPDDEKKLILEALSYLLRREAQRSNKDRL